MASGKRLLVDSLTSTKVHTMAQISAIESRRSDGAIDSCPMPNTLRTPRCCICEISFLLKKKKTWTDLCPLIPSQASPALSKAIRVVPS